MYVFFFHLTEWCCVKSTKINGTVGHPLVLQCPYPPQHRDNRKFLCKGEHRNSCKDITSQSRFKLEGNGSSSSFSVAITKLEEADAGTYWCGSDSQWRVGNYTRIQLSVGEMNVAEEVIHVTGYVGSMVNVSCSYDEGYESYEKYLCKNDCGNSDVLITTSESRKNKYRIHDDKTARIFTTTISDLHYTDAGKYWCGVTGNGKDIYTEVKLKLENLVAINKYNHHICSVAVTHFLMPSAFLTDSCCDTALITSDTKQNGRFRLDDDKVSGTFTVNISSLTHNDSGSYLCGVQRNSDVDVFSAVELKVKEWCCVKSIKIKGTVGQPLALQCPYPPQHRDKGKFLCKGEQLNSCKDITSQSRFKLEGNGSFSSFSVVITKLEEADAGTYWCGSDSERIFTLWPGQPLLVAVIHVTGYMGSIVQVSCSYDEGYESYEKYLCKNDCGDSDVLITTSESWKRKYRINDDKTARIFTTTISDLHSTDAGKYWCGVTRNGKDIYTEVELKLVPGKQGLPKNELYIKNASNSWGEPVKKSFLIEGNRKGRGMPNYPRTGLTISDYKSYGMINFIRKLLMRFKLSSVGAGEVRRDVQQYSLSLFGAEFKQVVFGILLTLMKL
uniref:Immunoglobulin domain-containing protein n=1 Tax=Neolamprologus brichardi TaxID=32507 RepID=A0A3Q4IBJ0_NEOBR